MTEHPDLSRRHFLHRAGLLAAAAATAGPAAASGAVPLAPPDKQPPKLPIPPGETKKVGWAVVGLGQLALEEVLPAFAQCQHSRPVALVTGHPDKARKVAEHYGIDPKAIYGYDDYEKLKANPAVQVYYNILPNHMHAEHSIKAMQAGKDVLCEKPLTGPGQIDQAKQMCQVAKETKRKLMTAYRLQYEPFNLACVEILRSGQLGKLRVIEAQNLQNTQPPNIRLSKQTGGGPLGDVGVYCLQACRYLSGEEPTEVAAMEHQPSDDPRFAEVPENVAWQMRFPSGVLATCLCGFGSQESRQFRAVCSDGWLELRNAFAYRGQELYVMKGKELTKREIRPVDHFAAEMDHFSRCVLDDKPPKTPGEEGLRDMIIMDRITEAARTGQRLRVGELPA